MIEALSSVTKEMALVALDALMANHRAVATNIANHASEGYEAKRVDFESLMAPLADAMAAGASGDELQELVAEIKAGEAPITTTGEPVALDREVGELMKNTLQYQAVLTALGRLGSLNKIAIGGNQQ